MFSRITKREYHIKINVILSFCIPIIFNYIIVVNFFILSKVNFSVLENTISACFRISLFPIPIDISFAALMASAPAFASSIPAHCSGFNFNNFTASKYISGLGFPCFKVDGSTIFGKNRVNFNLFNTSEEFFELMLKLLGSYFLLNFLKNLLYQVKHHKELIDLLIEDKYYSFYQLNTFLFCHIIMILIP